MGIINKIKEQRFLFEELTKRDFAKKYKRTILGMAWSILSPLMGLLIMWMVFNNFAKEVDYFRKISTGGQDGTDYLWRVSLESAEQPRDPL